MRPTTRHPLSYQRDLISLPKAHLHVHFEAVMRPSTLRSFAAEVYERVPDLRFRGFTQFLTRIQAVRALIRTPEHLTRMMNEFADDMQSEGVVHVEVALAPMPHLFGSVDHAVQAQLADAAAAATRTGVSIGGMIAINRSAGPEAAIATARLAARYAGHGVVALGLHADERSYRTEDFAAAFEIGRDAGLLSTPHAGELIGPRSVWAAIDVLRADRVLHGVRATEDIALMAELADRRICLDVCPSSNVRLGVAASYAVHPLPALLAAGVPCSINADDPLLFETGLLSEYRVCRERLKLDDTELAECARSSVVASSAAPNVKAAALAGIHRWLWN